MSSIAANLASLARSKLRSSLATGAKDNLSLHRWVLLKNSITFEDCPCNNNSAQHNHPLSDIDPDEEDEEVDTSEDMFAFLFPDPGNASDTAGDNTQSEAQWLDSLLETLGQDEEDDNDEEDEDEEQSKSQFSSSTSSADESYSPPSPLSPLAVPYPVSYPSSHPPLVVSFAVDSTLNYLPPHHARFSYHDIDDLSVPDAIEDTSDDESEAPTTPFTGSRSSLNLVDPALVPLPREGSSITVEPRIYSVTDDYFGYEVDPLPYPDAHSDSPSPVYGPFHQNC